MRINEETILVGDHVILAPYRKEHVEKYNEWMQSPILQEQTASEPLSLKEEYEMQNSWWKDDDKLTFILLARENEDVTKGKMIGDVNVFLSDLDEEDHEDEQGKMSAAKGQKRGELEIMIAESSVRRKGHATEALQLLLWYITSNPTPSPTPIVNPSSLPLMPENLFVKISLDNQPSINMFKKLSFTEYKVSEIFNEVELRLVKDSKVAFKQPELVSRWPM
ncbi:unnamed protein product [Sympodiomycopsis kandeliae]